jgi:hypothetical protein
LANHALAKASLITSIKDHEVSGRHNFDVDDARFPNGSFRDPTGKALSNAEKSGGKNQAR